MISFLTERQRPARRPHLVEQDPASLPDGHFASEQRVETASSTLGQHTLWWVLARSLAPYSLLFVLVATVVSCGPGISDLSENKKRKAVFTGFEKAPQNFELTKTRYWRSWQDDEELMVENSAVGTGVSPIWFKHGTTNNFEVSVQASLDKEGLDGGWGIEFGGKDRKYAYRLLVYGSGRFCLDRLFGVYPEFIHCVPKQPQVRTGTRTNVLTVRVTGQTISVSVNGDEIVAFKDDRYVPGETSLAVAGAGTRVRFKDMYLLKSN